MSDGLNHTQDHPYLDAVLARSATDAGYRTWLQQDPVAAIKDETGVDLPAGFNVHFLERPQGANLVLLLPELAQEEDELDLDDLEAAAGGNDGYPPESPW